MSETSVIDTTVLSNQNNHRICMCNGTIGKLGA